MTSPIPPNFLDEPITPPPPGQHSNFVNPPSRAPELYITASVCLPLILIFGVLRFYAKVIIKKKKTWDDLTCILGLLAAISYTSISVVTVSGGAYGFHQWDITVRELSKEQLLLSLVIWAVYGPCLWFIKLCLFVLYLEIFGLLRWLRHLAIFGIVTTGLFYFASMVAFLVLCSPQSGHSQIAYLTALASPKCSKSMPLATVIGAVSVASDLYLVVLPLPAVWSLQLPFHRKIGVSAMFLTGFIACIASMLGLYYRVVEVGNVDNTWAVIPTWITTIVEITAGIIVCCMPSAAAVFVELRGPVSSFLAKSRKGFRSFTRSISTSHHENLGSTANLRPPFGDSNPQDNGQAQYEMQKLWSGPEGGWGECQAEPETMAVFPLEDTRIRKSTKVEVTRGSGKY